MQPMTAPSEPTPVATVMHEQDTVDVQLQNTTLKGRGRHDPCVLPRAVPMDALVSVISQAIPGWLLQRLLLVGAFLAGGYGIARLVRALRPDAGLAVLAEPIVRVQGRTMRTEATISAIATASTSPWMWTWTRRR